MYPIYTFGSEEQSSAGSRQWQGEKLGCFGLTEPTQAQIRERCARGCIRRNEYVLNGEKMWITSGSIADVRDLGKSEEHGGRLRIPR